MNGDLQQPGRPILPADLQRVLRRAHEALRAGALQDAENLFQDVLANHDNHVPALQGLAIVHNTRGDYALAERCLKEALKSAPHNASVHNNLGIVLQTQGRFHAALQCFETAKQLRPDFAEAHCNTGKIWQIRGELERAEAEFHRALQLAPGQPEALAGLAVQAELKGEYKKGLALIQPLIKAGRITPEAAVTYANLQRRLKNHAAAAHVAERALEKSGSQVGTMHLHFVLGDIYDELGQYDRAFTHYERGNRLSPMTFDSNEYQGRIDKLVQAFSASRLQKLARAGPREPSPIFIVGMPRSGTSLVEQILAGHPRLWAAGELDTLGSIVSRLPGDGEQYPERIETLSSERLEQTAAEYRSALRNLDESCSHFTDKMPANFEHLGLIELLFPNATIVHCVRNPLDTALSCYFQNFSARGLAFAFALEHIASYHTQYRRLMAHWREVLSLPVVETHYEAIVKEPEATTKQLCRDIGLSWQPELLDISRRRRNVPTASHAQIREPLYTRSLERWKHYAEHLAHVRASLEGRHA